MLKYRELPVNFKMTSGQGINTIMVCRDDGTPVDNFEVWWSLPDGWLGWVHTTVSEELLELRKKIVKILNAEKKP